MVLGEVKANVPPTLATPPLKVDAARELPKHVLLAVGSVVMVGVFLTTVMATVFVVRTSQLPLWTTALKYVVSFKLPIE